MDNPPLSYVAGAMLLLEITLTAVAIAGTYKNPSSEGRHEASREACVGVCCLFSMALAFLNA